jgi:hypothetical protein
MGEIWDSKFEVAQGLLDSAQASLKLLYPIPQPLHGRRSLLGWFFSPAELCDLIGTFLEFVPELLDLCRQCPPFLAQFLKELPRDVMATPSQ